MFIDRYTISYYNIYIFLTWLNWLQAVVKNKTYTKEFIVQNKFDINI